MIDIQKFITISRVVLLLHFAIIPVARANTFPQDFDYSYYSHILVDAGYLWHANSTFHPFTCLSFDSSQTRISSLDAFGWIHGYLNDYAGMADKLRDKSSTSLGVFFLPGLGIAGQTGTASDYNHVAMQPFIWTVARFRDNWYARLYIRATNEIESLPHYSGVRRTISRAGLNTGEIDQSIIGYQNEWTTVEYGRSREIWGPFAEDNLLLAGNAPAWERLMLQFNYRRFTYRWFFGFLETVSLPDGADVNRYMIGRALEYKNRHNLVLSVGEVSVIAGPNRPLDWSFLNPMALHLEVEQNNRENNAGDNRSNAILFLNADWLPIPKLRLTGSFIIDEFQIDREDRDRGAFDALGFNGRFAWTPTRKPVGLTLFGYYIRIDTYTLQHSYDYTNLVTRSEVIGHPIGNDADDLAFGVRLAFSQPLLLELKFGSHRWGDNSMLYDPYTGYSAARRGQFPSGEVRTNRYLALKARTNPLRNFSLAVDGHLDLKHSGEDSALDAWTFTVRYQIPFLITDI